VGHERYETYRVRAAEFSRTTRPEHAGIVRALANDMNLLNILPRDSRDLECGATIHELPIDELRRRGVRARDVLRRTRGLVGRPGALRCIDAALDEVDALLPGLMDRPSTLVERTVRGLVPEARAALRQAIDAERAATERLAWMLGDAPRMDVELALSRVEEQDAVLLELLGLLTLFEQAYGSPG
jgi:hypothetical protein